MIIGYFGNVRQGKTLSAVRELYKFHLLGYTIYSNTPLSFDYKPLTLDYLLDIVEKDLNVEDNSIFFIDEITLWADSRISAGKRNRIVSYFLLQSGKLGNNTDYGLILLFTAQFTHLIDKRLRHTLDIGVQCKKILFKGDKYFIQERHVFKGDKSYCQSRIFKGTKQLYELYDTRKKIKVEKDRYKEDI
jgi:hypothetical protein